MAHGFYEAMGEETARLHLTLLLLSKALAGLGVKVFIIGARSIMVHRVHVGRETRDWDVAIDKAVHTEAAGRPNQGATL